MPRRFSPIAPPGFLTPARCSYDVRNNLTQRKIVGQETFARAPLIPIARQSPPSLVLCNSTPNMTWWWQRWLSPRPSHRTNISSQSSFAAAGDAARFDVLTEGDGRWSVRETHHIENPTVKAGRSGPPLHIHLKQDEFFKVEQGILAVSLDGVKHILTKDDGVLRINSKTRHRFWSDQSATESLVFRGWTDPYDEDYILDISFLRNLQGYLADCHRESLQPSPWQLILFAYNASTVLTPPFWVPLWFLRATHYVLAIGVASSLLGYKASYQEYSGKPRSE
ncbi:hypothetical protein HD806DRAFT_483354 [Xylariaceae sp. AK1471]|nr:hypothetical protein HD806DRAFT_483354 [Xylariaceae sp. AK1471]